MVTKQVKEFRSRVEQLPRDEIVELIRDQDPELIRQMRRIEWVFAHKLSHITDNDGRPITERPFTNEELTLLVDPPFMVDKDLLDLGISVDQQQQIHVAADPVLWAKHFLDVEPRLYQILMLRDPSLRRVFRLGRRLGKTWTLAVVLLHYAYTTTEGRCLVMAPMKSQVELIYDECMKLAKERVAESITRSIRSPQHEIHMTTGSVIRYFTTGMKSGGRSNVARGQEAHVIVLDEMDYMGADDLDALYVMLMRTAENQPDKMIIGASTPTGRRERFWYWATQSDVFKEFYYPAYCSPLWDKETELEMRQEYNEMAYRHEIEADWGEDVEGVYPRKYVDIAFQDDWVYRPERTAPSIYLMGVDWDKYGAGPNICVLEVCSQQHEDEKFAGKLRIAFREEIPQGEYALTTAVQRVIELNERFNPNWIYVDKGPSDLQVELLHQYGQDNPGSGLKKKVRGIAFGGNTEVRDPATKQLDKKKTKPFMVDNLRSLLENEEIVFPQSDEELYMQLISYVVIRTSSTTGYPVFGPSGSQVDHAHDALILACLAYAENYNKLLKTDPARHARSISGDFFMPFVNPDPEKTERRVAGDDKSSAPKRIRRAGVPRRSRDRIERSKF